MRTLRGAGGSTSSVDLGNRYLARALYDCLT
ncbi:unnamed protein product [Enterobius vermicularis]|uniref:Transcriptional regulator n=1 Tax=Enterobius vermicularis TaxID=51028 RepID=A0A0N4VNV4_ENTVE|nr:unnamed protein product [Enterobius vermicularis]